MGAKRLRAALPRIVTVLLLALAAGNAQTPDWLIVPGERVGAVRATSTLADLRGVFGAENVVNASIHVGEGFQEPGILVFPQDPTRRLAIVPPREGDPRKRTVIYICYQQRADGDCQWRTAEGITLGTNLKTLEAHNRRPFRLYGFGWDYEGTVANWRGGRLAHLQPHSGGVFMRLRPPRTFRERQSDSRLEAQVTGAREFSSGHPAMQSLNPVVYDIGLELFKPDSPSGSAK